MALFDEMNIIRGKFREGDIVEVKSTGQQAEIINFEIFENPFTNECQTDGYYLIRFIDDLGRGQLEKIHEDELKFIKGAPPEPFTLNTVKPPLY
jgi:uncharacterized protein YodC (DUF2158 family)